MLFLVLLGFSSVTVMNLGRLLGVGGVDRLGEGTSRATAQWQEIG